MQGRHAVPLHACITARDSFGVDLFARPDMVGACDLFTTGTLMFVSLITALSAVGASSAIQSSAWKNPTLEATPIMGQEPSTLAMYGGALGGVAATLIGMPFLAGPLFGMAAGAYAARDGLTRTKTAFQEFLTERMVAPPVGAAAAGGGPRPFQVFAGGAPALADSQPLVDDAPATLGARLAVA